jgi:RHS repeat-associated protein
MAMKKSNTIRLVASYIETNLTSGVLAKLAAQVLLAIAAIVSTIGNAYATDPVPTITGQRSSSFHYHATNRLLLVELVEPDNVDLCVRTAYGLNRFGNRVSTTVSNCAGASGAATFTSRKTTYEWTAYSVGLNGQTVSAVVGTFPTNVVNALGQTERRYYDARFGEQVRAYDHDGLTARWDTDEFGRPWLGVKTDNTRVYKAYCWLSAAGVDTSSNSAGCTTPTYTPAGAVRYVQTQAAMTSVTPNGPRTRIYYDMLDRVIREETEGYDSADQPSNARTILKDTEYNEWGAAVKVTQPYYAGTGASVTNMGTAAGWTVTDYDALGRPVNIYSRDDEGSATYAGQAVAQASFTYNGLSVTETRLRTSKNAQGQQQAGVNLSTTRISNAIGQLVQVIDGQGGNLRKRYDAFGNVVEVRDAQDNRTLTTYDTRGRKTQLTDPNAGTWQYRYNALGELVGQLSPTQGTWTTMTYDMLGRMTQRAEPEYITTWVYDSCTKGTGKLCQSVTSHGVTKSYTYDSLGRPAATTQAVTGGPSFTASRTYNAGGRLASYTYPSGMVLTYGYTALGYLQSLKLQGQNTWTLRSMNAWGKAERYETGSASQTTSELYDPVTGRTTAMRVGDWASQNAHILSQTYGWDTVGNLTDRSDRYDASNSVTENFGYDALNRLVNYQTSSAGIAGLSKDVSLTYNAIGNITSKSDVGTYNYPPSGATAVRPGAVTSITGASARSYSYDAAGNLTSSSGGKYSTIAYTSFNLPATLSGSAANYSWQYGPDHERVREQKSGRDTWYFHPDNQGGLAYESDGSNLRHYINAMGKTIAMVESSAASPASVMNTQWWHTDHLGSVAAITNASLQVTQRFSYDPFGKRRQINGTYDAMGTLVYDHPNSTDRGFTGHEHLDDVGVIHMNGRTYDPHIGRFMQADPIIQEADNNQNYNRFSYVMNNPLNATDPSGHSFKKIVRVAVAIAIAVYAPQLLATMGVEAAAVVAASSSVSCLAMAGTIATNYAAVGMFAGGFAAGVVGSGSLEGGIQGAMTAGLFHGAAGFGTAASPERYAAHAAAGCANGAMGGNGCGRGAVSALAGKWATNNTPSSWGNEAKFAAAVVAGGTASALGGGKFENGATTAAFAYLFNELAHQTSKLQRGYADKTTKYRYDAGWIDAEGNPRPYDSAAARQDLAALTDVGGTVASLGTAACVAFSPCAAGAITGGIVVGTGLSIANSAAQASLSSTPVDYIIDSVAALVPKGLRFISQIGSEIFKKTDAVDNAKKSIDSYVKP